MSEARKAPTFGNEIEILDKIYLDLVEGIHEKPDPNDVEKMRIYIDNMYAVINRAVLNVKEVKNGLERGEKLIHETWNPPA
ncbi:MAG: hypothetical protein GF419_10530 [Ignavibacteriales bacterium]|nr:hypothetical protein [Ignavibacteriales bacterium]